MFKQFPTSTNSILETTTRTTALISRPPLLVSAKNNGRGKSSWKRWTFRLLVMGLLLLFIWRLNLNPTQIWADLLRANLGLVTASMLLIFPITIIKTWRWCLLLKSLGLELAFPAAFRLYALGLAMGSFTPGQAGDAIKAWYLRDKGFKLSATLVSVILDRLLDVMVLALWASAGLLVLGAAFTSELPALLVLLLGVSVALLSLSLPKLRGWLVASVVKLIMQKAVRKQTGLAAGPEENSEGEMLLAPTLKPLLLGFGATLATSSLAVLRVWLLALAIGLPLNFLEVIAASSLATVMSLIPVSVAGIGTRDLALIGILSKLGYSRESAIILSSLILLHNLVNLIAGYAIWATRPDRSSL